MEKIKVAVVGVGSISNHHIQGYINSGKAELCAFCDGAWIRIACELVEDDRYEAKKSMLDAYPDLRHMYDENDGNTQVFYMQNAVATIASFGGAPVVIKF